MKRGPYKRYLLDPSMRVPRQTRHNWRELQRFSPAEPDALGQSSLDVGLNLLSGHNEVGDGDGNDTDAEADSDRECQQQRCRHHWKLEGGATEMHASRPASLYPVAQITEEMGVKLLATRHRLSFFCPWRHPQAGYSASSLTWSSTYLLPTNPPACWWKPSHQWEAIRAMPLFHTGNITNSTEYLKILVLCKSSVLLAMSLRLCGKCQSVAKRCCMPNFWL